MAGAGKEMTAAGSVHLLRMTPVQICSELDKEVLKSLLK
jgi:hypothetical protein